MMTNETTADDLTDEEKLALKALKRARELQDLEGGDPRRTYRQHDFLFDTAQGAFWCRPTGALVAAASVNAMIPLEHWRVPPVRPGARVRPQAVAPAKDIARVEAGTLVEGSTWLPGHEQITKDIFASKDGFFPVKGVRMFNTFRPGPTHDVSLADQATPWVDHIIRMFPEPIEHEWFFDYCAHMIQNPAEKANSALVISGKQGIGKDAALLPLRAAVGIWNCRNISPDALFSQFNPYVECVMLTIDEVRPMDNDHKATSLYNSLKTLITTPPETIAMNDKRDKVRYVANVLRLFATTNDRLALYIPPEDRRIMVLHSDLQQRWHHNVDPDYFVKFFRWLEGGGLRAVAGWLAARDISKWNPKGDVPKTDTWAEISQRWDAPEDELTVALSMLGDPDCVFSTEIVEQQFDGNEELRRHMKGKGFIFRMQQAGYRMVPLPKGEARWQRMVNGWQFRAGRAYVKDSLGLAPKAARERIEERLRLRAEAGPRGKVPQGPRLTVVHENGAGDSSDAKR